MIDLQAEPMVKRLSPVRCGQCSRPVTHLNKAVPGAEVGALCTNCSRGERMRVYTFYSVAPCECGCHR